MTRKPVLAAMVLTLAGALAAPAILPAQEAAETGTPGAPGSEAVEAPRGVPGFDFAEADTDGDGSVTRAELDAWRAGRVGALDADGDGFVSAAELTARMTARAEERIARRVERQMAARDSDGDGRLSAAEMIARPVPARLFERADADGDGAVTEAEIAALRAEMGEGMRGARGRGHGSGERGMRGDHGTRGGASFWDGWDE